MIDKSQIELFKPEQMPGNELKLIVPTSAPTIGNTNVSGSQSRHPKCKGFTIPDIGNGADYDCGYNTTITCDECKYCLGGYGRKDPEAKRNQDCR